MFHTFFHLLIFQLGYSQLQNIIPLIDKLSTDDDFENDCFDEIVKDAEEALANESEIKSLNFRS